MLCPYCQKEMQAGRITADARSRIYFEPQGVKRTFADRLVGVGRVEAAKGGWSRQGIDASYCPTCKKMIFDTEITK